jgi:hypothetical protein
MCSTCIIGRHLQLKFVRFKFKRNSAFSTKIREFSRKIKLDYGETDHCPLGATQGSQARRAGAGRGQIAPQCTCGVCIIVLQYSNGSTSVQASGSRPPASPCWAGSRDPKARRDSSGSARQWQLLPWQQRPSPAPVLRQPRSRSEATLLPQHSAVSSPRSAGLHSSASGSSEVLPTLPTASDLPSPEDTRPCGARQRMRADQQNHF